MPNGMPETALAPITETARRLDLPGYYQDPMVAAAQTPLFETGRGLVTGELPEYYKQIGQIGGPAFEDVMRGTVSDITRAVTEDVARRPGRGGLAADVISRAVGRVTPGLRWEEMKRGLGGRERLLGVGAGMLAGVRGAGITVGAGKRQFELARASMGLGAEQFEKQFGFTKERFKTEMAFREKQLEWEKEQYRIEQEEAEKARKSGLWGDIITGGLGAVGTILGGPLGGKLFAPRGAAGGTATSAYERYTPETTGFGRESLAAF